MYSALQAKFFQMSYPRINWPGSCVHRRRESALGVVLPPPKAQCHRILEIHRVARYVAPIVNPDPGYRTQNGGISLTCSVEKLETRAKIEKINETRETRFARAKLSEAMRRNEIY